MGATRTRWMRAVAAAFLTLVAVSAAGAATFTGTNSPGVYQEFSFTLGASDAPLKLRLPASGGVGSHLLLKKGAPLAGNADYHYSSRLDGAENVLYLEAPEASAGTWYVRVLTPATAAGSHAFTLTQTAGAGAVDATLPVTKPQGFTASGSLALNATKTYRVELPAGQQGWRLSLSTPSASSDLTLSQVLSDGGLFGVGSSSDRSLHTLLVPQASLAEGAVYHVAVHADEALTFTLRGDAVFARELAWDPGTEPLGTAQVAQPDTTGGDYLYRITARNTAWGAWRHALRVTAGEAHLYLERGDVPGDGAAHQSARAGDDGLVLDAAEFSAGETWYLRVHAEPGAQWTLWSGDVHVRSLGTVVASPSAAGGPVQVGPEGVAYFSASVGAATRAWRLWTPGAARGLTVRKAAAPVPSSPSYYEQAEAGQMLLVPPYLSDGLYVVGVTAPPRASVTLDSRTQEIRSAPGGGYPFAFTLSGTDDGGYGYVTYRIDVPVEQIAWQVACTPTSGGAHVYLRQGEVPNRWNNDGFSEALGLVTDTVTQVPPTLTDGAWYVTVYGTGTFGFTLASGNPVVTGIPFVGTAGNGAAFENRAGWRYFAVSDIASQVGTLGWELELAGQVPGTEIAVRRNAVPARWQYRQNGFDFVYEASHVDGSSTTGLLQRPGHPADVWYVGVHTPNAALGPFSLTTRALPYPALAFNGGVSAAVSGHAPGTWKYFRVDAPAGALGWDVRLTDVTAGTPRLVVRRGVLPDATAGTDVFHYGSWAVGQAWAAGTDWTGRPQGADGSDESGRVLAMGMGNPLEPGTYYVGVYSDGASPAGYRVRSRGIGLAGTTDGGGAAWALPVVDLAFAGGEASPAVGPREAAYYRISVPAGAASWALELTASAGEMMLAVRRDRVPNVTAGTQPTFPLRSDNADHFLQGVRRQKGGGELFYKYPDQGEAALAAGTYYVAVVGEGLSPSGSGVGTGTASGTLRSLGAMPVDDRTGSPLAVGATITLAGQNLPYGHQRAHRFRVDAGVRNLEVRLRNRSGQPTVSLHRGAVGQGRLPAVQGNGNATDRYGAEEGGANPGSEGEELASLADPAGDVTVLVAAGDLYWDPAERSAAYDLEVKALGDTPVAFNGGLSAAVAGQDPGSWRYFVVQVPAGALGWDLRLTQVTSGRPRLVVRRDQLPDSPGGGNDVWHYDHWETGWQWAAGHDWTGRGAGADGADETGRIVAMGMGNPLEPGTYQVGVYADGDAPAGYRVWSRGIGLAGTTDGAGAAWALPVADLAFTGGTASPSLAPREAAYYRVAVPAGAASWWVQVTPSGAGEALLAVRKDHVPNVTAGTQPSYPLRSDNPDHFLQGVKRQKAGREFFYKLPDQGSGSLAGGVYYLAVVGEGQTPADVAHTGTGSTSCTVKSVGVLAVDSRTATPLALGATMSIPGQALFYGQQKAYRFRVQAGVKALEVRLRNRTGEPVFSLHRAAQGQGRLPRIDGPGPAVDRYGAEEGGADPSAQAQEIATLADPTGDVTLLVAAGDFYWAQGEPDAAYDLEVSARGEEAVAFNGGLSGAVSGQDPGAWRHFVVDVPTGALGWDLRLTEVTSGAPRLFVRRGAPPESPWSNSDVWHYDHWEEGWQWAAAHDWTGRGYGADGSDELGRVLAMGFGNPLEPGTYYVGVYAEGEAPAGYRLWSRGIGLAGTTDGAGAPWALPVADLAFEDGTASPTVAPREAAYYRVTVPAGAASWALELTPSGAGEALLAVRKDHVPNVTAGTQPTYPLRSDNPDHFLQGVRRQKAGREFFYKFPDQDTSSLAGGVFFVAVVGEGQSPPDASRVGTGSAACTVRSLGELSVDDRTGVPLALGAARTLPGQALAYGQQKAYRFRVPAGLGPSYLEARLVNRVGEPLLSVHGAAAGQGRLPEIAGNGEIVDRYGAEEGGASYPTAQHSQIVTVAQPAGDYTVLAAAGGEYWSSTEADATCDLEVAVYAPPELAFDGGEASGTLVAGQSRFYRVDVPALVGGEPVAGWRLSLAESAGDASLRVRKDALPSSSAPGLAANRADTLVVPPVLTPGTWYVEVVASGLTEYSLSSHPATAERTWAMPAKVGFFSTPGLAAPVFGDSGVDVAGVPIVNPGTLDQGTDLEQGAFHLYRVVVPAGNAGLLHTRLEALSGNTDLYLRAGAPPTLDHDAYGNGGTLYDRHHTGAGTQYASWVPLDGRVEAELTPGEWWLAVTAVGSNARYRLILSAGGVRSVGGTLQDAAGLVQDLAQAGGSRTGQALAAGDMRFYRVQVPASSTTQAQSTPVSWTVTLAEQAGDVAVFVRDTVPSGQGEFGDMSLWWCPSSGSSCFQDWYDDATWADPNPYAAFDEPGSHALVLPPVRPGNEYYLGVYAKTDAVFDLSSSVGATRLGLAGVVNFFGGTASGTLAAGARRVYRIDVPADATRWKHTATHADPVKLYLQEGTVPLEDAYAHWSSAGANAGLNQSLYYSEYRRNYPWQAGRSYYLVVRNTATSSRSFSFAMDGRTLATEDEDGDGLPDAWERMHGLDPAYADAQADPDGDGFTNLEEYQAATEPMDEGSHPSTVPVLGPIGARVLTAGSSLRFPIAASDRDGDALTVTATGLPTGAALVGGELRWAPGTGQAGTYTVTITASDGTNEVSETITLRVEAPEPPGWRHAAGDRAATGAPRSATWAQDGPFEVTATIPCAGTAPAARTGDVDGDGRLDLVTVAGTELRIRYGNRGKADAVATLPAPGESPVLADATGDQAAEILVGSSGVLANQVKVYRGDGTLLHTVTGRAGTGDPAGFRMLPAAYLGDGKLAVAYDSGPQTDPRGYAAFDLASGAELWHYDVGPSLTSVAAADTDADGTLEFLASVWTPADGATGNGTTDSALAAILVGADGSEKLTQGLPSGTAAFSGAARLVPVDLDADGVVELVAAVGRDANAPSGPDAVQVLRPSDGAVLRSLEFYYLGADARLVVFDLDGDGAKEIAFSTEGGYVWLLDKDLNVLLTSWAGTLLSAGDLDGDGLPELFTAAGDTLRVLDAANLAEKWNVSLGGEGSPAVQAAFPSDVDGDGRAEVVVTQAGRLSLLASPPALVSVSASADPPAAGAVTGAGTYAAGSEASLTAAGAAGYGFAGWTGDITSTENPLRFTVAGDTAVTAHFAALGMTVDVDAPSPQPPGTSVTFTGQATPAAQAFEYRFWHRGPATGDLWKVVRDYAPGASWTFTPDLADSGANKIRVQARRAGSAAVKELEVILDYTVSYGLALTLDPPAPREWGAAVTASCGVEMAGDWECRFLRKGPATGNLWQVVQNYGGGNTWLWNTLAADSGLNQIKAQARRVGSGVAKEREVQSDYRLLPKLTVSSSPASPSRVGVPITFTGSTQPSNRTWEYRFMLRGPSTGGAWVLTRNYTTSPDWSWTPPAGQAGLYKVKVRVREAGSGVVYETETIYSHTVNP